VWDAAKSARDPLRGRAGRTNAALHHPLGAVRGVHEPPVGAIKT